MRFVTIAGAAAMLMLSVAAPAAACSEPGLHEATAAATDLSAAKKKPMAKKPKEKVEYMRAAS
jgi:hypothetical protein